MTPPRILIAGIGNIFLGDDGFGVEVARELLRRRFPENVHVGDFGIRGMDLTYALLDGVDVAVLVDAAPRGQTPGTLSLIEAEAPAEETPDSASIPLIDMHAMDPVKVLRLVAAMGGRLQRIFVVACEPAPLADVEEMSMGLSAAVQAAIPEAVAMVESLVVRICAGADESAQALAESKCKGIIS